MIKRKERENIRLFTFSKNIKNQSFNFKSRSAVLKTLYSILFQIVGDLDPIFTDYSELNYYGNIIPSIEATL